MNPLTEIIGMALVHFTWQAALVAAVAAAALRLLRDAPPATRYLTAGAALGLMVAAPLITGTYLGRQAQAPESPAVAASAASPAGDAQSGAEPHRPATTMAAPVLAWVVGAWATGVALLLIRLGRGWWHVRRCHRQSLIAASSRWQAAVERLAARLDVARRIRVVDSLAADSPAVIGWLRPVIVVPVAGLAGLTPSQVEAILAHEVAHIRRHDFAVNLLQTLAETALFYHPAVWWISGRIRAEREHCCDAIAVDVCGDAVAYADALTELETWRAAAPLAVAATGGPLLERIRRVLGAPAAARRRPRAMAAAIWSVLVALLLTGGAQAITALQPDAVVEDAPAAAWRIVFDHPSGELTLKGYTGRDLIRLAYDVPAARVVGGPGWLDDESLDLSTRLDEDPGADGIQAVVRTILESRLGLTVHIEQRDFPAYALVSATSLPGAPGLQPATRACVDVPAWLAAGNMLRDVGARRPCGSWRANRRGFDGVRVTIGDLAARLESQFRESLENLDVVDRTGLTGEFDLTLEMSPLLSIASRLHIPGVVHHGIRLLPGEMQQQLGVTFERTSAPYDVVVVGNVHRPTEP